MTPYHAKYYAHELSRTGGDGVVKIGRALFIATVELNPHQIEDGLVLCQHWAVAWNKIIQICFCLSARHIFSFHSHAHFDLSE